MRSPLALALLLAACTDGVDSESTAQEAAPAATCRQGTEAVILGVRDDHGAARLVLCTDYAAETYVNQLVLRAGADLSFRADDVVVQTGLGSMLFGNTDGVHVEAAAAGRKVVVNGGEFGVLTFERDDGFKVSGPFDFSDPLSACFGSAGGSVFEEREFKAGTARMRAQLCTGAMNTSGGYSYEVVGLLVEDENERLASPVKVELSGADLADKVTVKVNHHNVCDSMVVRLEGVTYGITSVGGVAAGPEDCDVAEGAPKLNSGEKARFRNLYGGEHLEEGELPFKDFYR